MGTPQITRDNLERETTRTIRLHPASPLAALSDLPILRGETGRFAVTGITETLRQTPAGITYTVHARGQIVTAAGRLSAGTVGRITWVLRTAVEDRPAVDTTGAIPEDVRALLAGPLALAGTTDLVPVTEAATW